MNLLLAFIRMFRLPNLAIVFLTQYLPYWYVLRPAILKAGGIPVLDTRSFNLIAAATVLTTFGGYVLNDYYDRFMDAINKPKRVVWGRLLPSWIALLVYAGILFAVHAIAFWLDASLRPANRWPLWVFPGVSFLLFLYAWQLKCSVFVGNLLVSILCGIVPIMLLFPEDRQIWLTSFKAPELIQQAGSLVWLFGLFAFSTNLFREQVKDIEDFQGDSACGCSTLPVLRGSRFAKKPAAFTGLLVSGLIAFLLYFWRETGAPQWQIGAGVVLLLMPSLAASAFVLRGKVKKDYTRAALLIKIVMVCGLLLLLRDWPEDPVAALSAWMKT
ncbi:MAG: geranylgeranylglycerol-phosphate geranylgeranyltransferase [Chitinophagales bacterium]|nr:geranylgeranylglycerol-phosphate geranylgeranyltransferase [Chitinophagales bacterium]